MKELLQNDNLHFVGIQIDEMPMNVVEACFCSIFCENVVINLTMTTFVIQIL
jgi:hypothetical protein